MLSYTVVSNTNMDSLRIPKWVVGITTTMISVLFAGNVFFVNKLVNKIDATEQIVWQLRQEIAVLKVSVDAMHRRRSYRE